MRIVKPSATLLSITPSAEKIIERAGRTCYKSEDMITSESAGKFIRKIIASGHHSVLEHASASFLFVCDRGVTHEMVRHRLVAYSQESTRFCNYGKSKFGSEITVIEPFYFRSIGRLEQRTSWRDAMKTVELIYLALLDDGCPPQIARSVLPNSLKTEIVATCNLREWRHIFKLRTSKAAHPQIKEIMDKALATLTSICPNVFHDFQEKKLEN